jgi:hypothetical protein
VSADVAKVKNLLSLPLMMLLLRQELQRVTRYMKIHIVEIKRVLVPQKLDAVQLTLTGEMEI